MAAWTLTLAWAVDEEVGTWQHIDPWRPMCPHSINVTQGWGIRQRSKWRLPQMDLELHGRVAKGMWISRAPAAKGELEDSYLPSFFLTHSVQVKNTVTLLGFLTKTATSWIKKGRSWAVWQQCLPKQDFFIIIINSTALCSLQNRNILKNPPMKNICKLPCNFQKPWEFSLSFHLCQQF